MANSSIIIESTDTNGVAKSKAISNINSAATGEQLQELAQRITALTTNQYTGANVISKCDVTEYSSGGSSSSSTGLLDPQLTYDYDRDTGEGTGVITWLGNGVCKKYTSIPSDMDEGFDIFTKGDENHAGYGGIWLLESDGVYARSFLTIMNEG